MIFNREIIWVVLAGIFALFPVRDEFSSFANIREETLLLSAGRSNWFLGIISAREINVVCVEIGSVYT